MPKILLCDDEPALLFTLSEALDGRGYETVTVPSAEAALARLDEADVVVTDLVMGAMSGLDLVRAARASDPLLPVILLTARGSERVAVEAMRAGAYDYLTKPFGLDELRLVVARAAEASALRRAAQRSDAAQATGHAVVGESPRWRALVDAALRVARREVPVLLRGETGTGKELVASMIHAASARRARPCVRVNCAAIPAELAESELFGHAKGAFTGATSAHRGWFAQADGGTLVLDEVGELPLAVQARLLRALQSGEIQPVGAGRVSTVDVRVVEFADGDLAAATSRGRVRVVVSNNPEAEIFLNSQPAGRGTVTRDNVADGEVVVLVRAAGFDDFTQRCTVSATQPCEVTAQLARAAQFGTLHVTAPGLTNAQVFLNDETQGRPLGDVAQVPVGSVRLTVRADNHEPWVRTVTVAQGDNAEAIVATPRRTGPTEVDVARRRAGISTFGAAPLTRGDGAFDAILSYGAMPVELRATMGFVPHNSFPNFGNFTIDGGIAVRTAFNWYEVELRSRAGWRFANDLIAVGGEVRAYGALGFRSSRGFGMVLQGNLSFQFNMGNDTQAANGETPVGGVGAFTISLNGGAEFNLDNAGGYNLTLSGNRDAPYTLCDNRNVDSNPATNASGFTGSTCEVANTARGFVGLVAELGLFRHLSFVASGTLYLPFPEDIQYDASNTFQNPGSNVSRRPITTSFWDSSLPINLRLGITYKF